MLKYELKKVFLKRTNQIILTIVFLIAIMGGFLAIRSVRYIDTEGEVHIGMMSGRRLSGDKNRWKGELKPEQIKEVVSSIREMVQKYPEEVPDSEYGKTMQSYGDISDFVIGILTPDSEWDDSVLYQLPEEQVADIYDIYQNNMKRMSEEYGTTPEKKEFLQKQYKKIGMPIFYEAKTSWDALLMYTQTYVIILAIVVGFLATRTFSEEFHRGTEEVFFSAKYGRSKAIKSKIVAGILMTTSVYWVGMGILILFGVGVMGTSGFSTLYQISDPYSIYVMTYGEYYLLMLLGGYIASLFSTVLTMYLTVKMHTPNIAIGIPFFLFCMLPFIGRALPTFATFFDIMPSVFSNVIEYVKKPLIFQIGGIVFRQLPFIMLLYSILFIAILPFVYTSYRRYGMQKN